MRILHVADWRLGRAFHGVDLTPDLAAALSGLLARVEEHRPGVVLIAGSLHEHASPSRESVELSDQILCRIVLDLETPVVLQAGHAERAERLTVGSQLLARAGLHVVDSGWDVLKAVELKDEHGPVDIHAIPPSPASVGLSLEAALESIRSARKARGAERRSLLLACGWLAAQHAPAGLSLVEEQCLEGFSYVALGGLRRPAEALGGKAWQPGGLLPEGFSDAGDSCCVNLVEMDARGKCRVQRLELPGPRRFRTLEGKLAELLEEPESQDYLLARLTDMSPLVNPSARLRQHFPNLMEIDRPVPARVPGGGAAVLESLFASWFSEAAGEELSPEQQRVVAGSAAAAVRSARLRRERES